jgi:hypothetical protein
MELDGRDALIMDFAAGGDLAGRLKRGGPQDCAEAVRVVAGCARGLAHVHAHGVIHRDLKPGNVLFSEDGTPMVVDFGIAHVVDAETLTRTGQALGTIAYMAPEQVDDGKRVDVRTDVYALGALLFATLTGRPPFEHVTQITAIYAVLRTTAPPLRSVRPDVPYALEAIVAKALRKDPSKRYPDATAFAEALLAADLEANPPSPLRWPLSIALVVCAAIALATALLSPRPGGPPPAVDPPVTAVETPPPEASTPEEPAWTIKGGDRLSYLVTIHEVSPSLQSTPVTMDYTARLGLSFEQSAEADGVLTLDATWVLQGYEFENPGASGPMHLPTVAFSHAEGQVAFRGTLDPVTGGVEQRAQVESIADLVIKSPQMKGLKAALTGATVLDASLDATLDRVVRNQYRDGLLLSLVKLLFEIRPGPAGMNWTPESTGVLLVRAADLGVLRAIPSFGVTTWPRQVVRVRSGRLAFEAGRPVQLHLEQSIVTPPENPSPDSTSSSVTFELER